MAGVNASFCWWAEAGLCLRHTAGCEYSSVSVKEQMPECSALQVTVSFMMYFLLSDQLVI